MTTEEEKAEESCRKNRQSYWNSTEHYIQGYIAGLHEGQPKWHDLRKDPNDLPNEESILLLERWNKQVAIGFYYKGGEFKRFNENIGLMVNIYNVIAWCEIPQFKE